MEAAGVAFLQQQRSPAKDVPFFRRKRYFVAFMVAIVCIVVSWSQVAIAIVLVPMTTPKNITVDGVVVEKADYNWSPVQVGLLLSLHGCFSVFAFIGGWLASRFGSGRMLSYSFLINGLLHFCSPVMANRGFTAFGILQVLLGATGVIAFNSWMQIFLKWVPTKERFRIIDFTMASCFVGLISGFLFSALISELWSWEYVYHIVGLCNIVWFIVWIIFVSDEPEKDKFMSREEKRFILENIQELPKKIVYPWRKILTSKAVWAFLNERFVEGWSVSFLLSGLPSFIQDSFDVTITHIGLLSSLPNVCNFLGIVFGGLVGDYLRNRKILSPPKLSYKPWFTLRQYYRDSTVAHFHESAKFLLSRRWLFTLACTNRVVSHSLVIGVKEEFEKKMQKLPTFFKIHMTLISVGQLSSIASLLAMGLCSNFRVCIFLMCFLRLMYGFAESSYSVLPMDIGGEYAGLIHGMGLSIVAIGLIINPIVMKLIVANHSLAGWSHYFLFLCVFNIWGAVLFYFYGSGKPEPWTLIGKRAKSNEPVY